MSYLILVAPRNTFTKLHFNTMITSFCSLRVWITTTLALSFPGDSVVKNPPANAGDTEDNSAIPGLRRSPGRRNGNPLQYSCLENPMDRGVWWAAVHGVAKSQTWLSMHAPWLYHVSYHFCTCLTFYPVKICWDLSSTEVVFLVFCAQCVGGSCTILFLPCHFIGASGEDCYI